MAHELEVHEDGTAAFFSARVPAWHSLGTITDGALTADEAIKVAQLDWTVTKTTDPIAAPVMGENGIDLVTMPNKFLTYRAHPKSGELEALGVVGKNYVVVQNAESFGFLNYMTDEFGAVFETAGSLHGGRKVFVSMKMPKTMLIGGHDAVELYLLAWNSHDGMSGFNVVATPQRVVCQNTLTAGIRNAKSSWSIRHTGDVQRQVTQARETLGLTFAYADEFQKQANALIDQQFTADEFDRLVASLVKAPKDATDRQQEAAKATRASIATYWTAPTQANIAGTKWAAYNAITEWADWEKPAKNGDAGRATRVVADLGATGTEHAPLTIKRNAWRALASV